MAYRLFPSTSGPGSSTDSEVNSYGILFKVTDTGMVLQGYWYWRADSTAPASAAFALWQATGLNTGTYLGSGTYVATSTMVAGQWNYIPLATPYALTSGTAYKAVIGINGTHNLVSNQFGAGDPYAAGITSGPLVAYSAASGSNQSPYSDPQCTYGGGSNPATVYPNNGFLDHNTFLDVQVDYASTPVSGADTGAGADSGAVAVAVAGADTGAGADSGSRPGDVAGADTAAGADSGSVAAALSGSDTAAGADSGTLGVQTTTTGATFAPVIELAGGSTATVTWSCPGFSSQTGVSPSFSFGSAATRIVTMTVTGGGGYADVVTFNLGFNSTDDAGTYNMGAGYDLAPQAVTGVQNIKKLTGLIRFAAANSTLAGTLDFTGLSALQYIECHASNVQGVVLTGCTALIRLNVEMNNLSALDLNPVAGSLYDLRSAQQQGGSLTFTTLTAPMAVLYHFCIRDQTAINIPTPAQLPVVQQYWTWNDGLSGAFTLASSAIYFVMSYQNSYTSADLTGQFPAGRGSYLDLSRCLLASVTLTGCSGLAYIDLSVNRLSQAAVDSVLGTVAGWGTSGGTLNLASNTTPSSTGTGYVSTLTGRGWTITVDASGGVAAGADTGAGAGSGTVAVAVAGADTATGDAGPMPPGVTLQPIDGGPSFYQDNGFTYAVAAGWDDPSFFPVGLWLPMMLQQSDADRWLDLGINTAFQLTANSLPSLLNANGLWLVMSSAGGTPVNTGYGSETVGLNSYDEPAVMSDWEQSLQSTPNAVQDNRYWWLNNTWNFIQYGGITPVSSSQQVLATQVATPGGSLRGLSADSIDIYWFAGAAPSSTLLYEAGLLYNVGRDMTVDEASRGSHYGDMVDRLRAFQPTPGCRPILQFVEDGGPFSQDTLGSDYITPPQMNQAVWASIIHGARQISYFNHTFGGPATSDDNLAESYYQTVQPGQTVSIYGQVKATNALIKQLAPVLNSPVALGYFTVDPPPVIVSASAADAGVDAVARYYTGGTLASGFYIFATTRYSQSASGITATFTTADHYTGPVTVVGETRTVTSVNGVFTDVFAQASTVHIYRVGLDPAAGSSVAVSGADTGAGADSGSVPGTGAVAGSDTGAAAGSGAVAAAVSGADTGSGADSGSTPSGVTPVSGADTAAAADTGSAAGGGGGPAIRATQYVPHTGLQPGYTAAAAAGNFCATGPGAMLHVRNGDSVPHTVTIAVPRTVDGLAVASRSITVPAGQAVFAAMIGLYRDPLTGLAAVTYDGVTSVTIAMLRVP